MKNPSKRLSETRTHGHRITGPVLNSDEILLELLILINHEPPASEKKIN